MDQLFYRKNAQNTIQYKESLFNYSAILIGVENQFDRIRTRNQIFITSLA